MRIKAVRCELSFEFKMTERKKSFKLIRDERQNVINQRKKFKHLF